MDGGGSAYIAQYPLTVWHTVAPLPPPMGSKLPLIYPLLHLYYSLHDDYAVNRPETLSPRSSGK